MTEKIKLIINCGLFLCFFSCSEKEKGNNTKIEFRINAARDRTVYIETVPYTDEITKIIDSLPINSGSFKGILTISNVEERPLELRVSGSDIRIRFINDAPLITIQANILFPEKYSIAGSHAGALMENFINGQKEIIEAGKQISDAFKQVKSRTDNPVLFDSLMKLTDANLEKYFTYVKNFADTVSSPGVFLMVYNNVDFGKNFIGLDEFIRKAANRFPGHSRIQQLKNETLDFLSLLKEEFEPGQQLPDIQLKDTAGILFNTALSRGKYVFIDIGGSWCRPCGFYEEEKQAAIKKFPEQKLDIITIGLEPDMAMWRYYVRTNKFRGKYLMDDKVWNGHTQQTYKIDSIPFNFFLDPSGKILRKAIPADSVVSVLSGYIN